MITELANAPIEQRRAEVQFLLQLPDVRYLLPVAMRIKEEVRSAMLGGVPEPFLSRHAAQQILNAGLVDKSLWKVEAAQLSSDKEGFIFDERNVRAATLGQAGNQKQLADWVSKWFRDPVQRVREGALGFMRRHRVDFGLPDDDRVWPAPEAIRTLWAFQSYVLTRFYLVSRDGRRTDPNDQADWRHFTSAAYADQIVVQDQKFRQIISACPMPKPAVVTFDEWADKMLG